MNRPEGLRAHSAQNAYRIDDDIDARGNASRIPVSWPIAFRRALRSGSSASVLSALALALCGKLEGSTAAGPINGPSQWIWGRAAAYRRDATWGHTAVGYTIHHSTSIGWATLHEKYFAGPLLGKSFGHRLAAALVTASVACFVDFRLTPARLEPGFNKQLARPSLFLVYTAFALGLASRRR